LQHLHAFFVDPAVALRLIGELLGPDRNERFVAEAAKRRERAPDVLRDQPNNEIDTL
jgi:hypothetical protein